MLNTVQKLLDDPAAELVETLQALWSGYGEISRYYSPKLKSTIIVKSVNPPQEINHPRGWHSNVSHQRKLTSYQIEAHFYQHYAKSCNQGCYVPLYIVGSSNRIDGVQQILIMEDLKHLGFDNVFDKQNSEVKLSHIKAVITWLANFHALFLQHNAEGLWSTGTYWNLSTRLEEFNSMADSPLKDAAQAIDNQLNNAKYQTIVHGDAKLANFCFKHHDNLSEINSNSNPVAAVDFQYVGKGVGVKDLAYFLGSCLTDNNLNELHNDLLDFYFNCLAEAIDKTKKNHQTINVEELEQEWRQLYCFANADFLRFLQGWSPEHYKINSYLKRQSELAMQYFYEDKL